jgi:TP901 family phage tail tape measure protein
MASKTNISDYRFSIFINNDQAKRSLIEMEKTMMGYESDLKRLEVEGKKNTEEYKQRKEAITQLDAAMKEMRKEAGLQALSLKELKSLQSQLRNELARAIPGTEHRKKLETEFNAVGKRLGELQNGAKTTSMSFGKMADGFNKYFAIASAGIAAITGLAFSIKSLITAQGELSDSLADIRKSTGMTATEVMNLNKELGKIDTRTSRQDLRQMAVVAGQLGMAKEDVFAFVNSVDRLNVALGDEFTGGAEEVAKQMGMLRNVLTDSKTANVADDMMRVGNAINALGAAGFATGPVMTDFASRIGGIGIPLGLTSDEVLGLSATLQELNVNAERGGTAVVKILQKMTTNTASFASVAGMPVKEFTNLVNNDLYGAFLKVVEGSKRGGQSATDLAGIIKDLEISGVGASEIFAKLGTNTDLLAEKTKLAGSSLQGTDSITNEFNIKNATLGATLAKLQKDFYSLVTMPNVTEFFKNQVLHVVQLVNWLKDLPLIIEKYRIVLIALSGAIGVWVAALTRSLQVSLLNNLTMKEGILLKAKDAIVMEYLIVREQMLTIWKGNGTAATKLATTAQLLWNTVVKANPIGLLIVGITALVAAIKAYDKYNSETIRNERTKASTIERMNVVNKTLSDNYQYLNEQIRTLNKLSQTEKQDLDEKIDKNIKLAETELALMKSRQQKVQADNSKPTIWQKTVNAVKTLGAPVAGAMTALNNEDATNNGKAAADQLNDGIKAMEDNLKNLKSTKSQLIEITRAEQIGDGILAKTQEALSEKLTKYQTALRNTTANSEDYNRIQQKIKQTNGELAKFDNSDPASDKQKNLKKLKTDYEKLNEQIQELVNLLQKEVLSDPVQAKVIADKIQRLKNYKDAIDEATKSLLENAEAEGGKLDKVKSKGLKTGDKQVLRGRQDHVWGDGELPQKVEEPKGALGVDVWGAKAEQFMGYANTVLSGLMNIDQLMTAHENAQLQKDANANDVKKANLKRQLDAKRITQKQYDTQVLKMDKELDDKKREMQVRQAKRQKALSLVQAIINTAQGITAALANPGGVFGAILAVLVGLMGAVQIGYIASTPVPEAAKGRYKAIQRVQQAAMGRYDVLGQDDKKQYRGVPYMQEPPSGMYGQPTLFAETGKEIILNPKHTENLMKFRPDLIESIMQVPQRAGGLYPDAAAQRSAAGGPGVVQFHPDTLKALNDFQEQLKKPIISNIVYDDMRNTIDTVTRLEKAVTR